MLGVVRLLTTIIEFIVSLPMRVLRVLTFGLVLNPRLGYLRVLIVPAVAYVVFALILVYPFAFVAGHYGAYYKKAKLQYDDERWNATAIYDAKSHFVGMFSPQLDSQQDVNYHGRPIELFNGYVANPDHKAIPVRTVPEYYWKCLVYHEDRHLGTWLNPFGIDLMGVLKIPYSTVLRSVKGGGLRFGVGGSTLSMQLARIVKKTPPRRGESVNEKLGRKFFEWWMAPVIFRSLTSDGDMTAFKQWAADHLWLAQRTGGPPLHGVEMTSRIVFGKEAKDLEIAEQLVLASAVNKPIILLEGSERLNKVRLDRWRYIIEVRARKCAEMLIEDEGEKAKAVFKLAEIANGPPDPEIKPQLRAVLEEHAPRFAKAARANPALRANMLIPAAIYGVRQQMKDQFGFAWRNHVRGVSVTLDVAANRAFRSRVQASLAKLQKRYQGQINGQYTLDFSQDSKTAFLAPEESRQMPDVVIAAANEKGEIVRFFESTSNAAYFGSHWARDPANGRYLPGRESRAIASVGKILAALAIANTQRDGLQSVYVDRNAPERGLETCKRNGTLRRGRSAEVVFACSLSAPLEWRTARLQKNIQKLIDDFGFVMPRAFGETDGTPPSTAVVRGLVTGSPQRVHHMSSVVLGALLGRGDRPVSLPSLVRSYSHAVPSETAEAGRAIVPNDVLKPGSRGIVKAFLAAPLCYERKKKRMGTLKSLAAWCHQRRKDIRFHFAKTGTHVNEDPDATVDVWTTGGLQFANGAAYSYVVMVGTGSSTKPWARKLHAAQVAAPLAEVLLKDLQAHAEAYPRSELLPAMARSKPNPVRANSRDAARRRVANTAENAVVGYGAFESGN